MSILAVKPEPFIQEVDFKGDCLLVSLMDGREVRVPLEWFPKLKKASPSQRKNFRLIGHGAGIHWPEIDEDISVEGLLKL
ncbi:MAG: DUF2442 domain-containing protein [Deltaproteobacteria bacterium]|nr:DUF2442 domain-containing protein [Deltaproteobacteria bacterium]MBI4224577.1 DUF2442 domain-containing protein [Deltaproteobacteria bacterium]